MSLVGWALVCVCCESCACAAAVHSVVFFVKHNDSQGFLLHPRDYRM